MKKKEAVSLISIMAIVLIGFSIIKWAVAGSLDPVAGPDSAASAMHTLEDIYNRLTNNTTATKRSGSFTDPAAAPGATGHTLDEIYEVAIPTRVSKTGQMTSQATGDDGDLEKGVAWPVVRFTDNGDGSVTDNLTGLVWLKNARCYSSQYWLNSLNAANSLASGICGLVDDGSVTGDWRLPNIKELLSLIDYGKNNPALPVGHPFLTVQSPLYYVSSSGGLSAEGRSYWTSTKVEGDSENTRWAVNMFYGQPVIQWIVVTSGTVSTNFLWPVRDGS